MNFNFVDGVSIYLQVAEQIEDGILSGAFPEDTQIPSTTEISVGYQINPATVLKGMTLLVEKNILYKKRGMGMFVQKGATEAIMKDRRKEFYDNFVVRLLSEAEKLKISKEELQTMIERGIKQ